MFNKSKIVKKEGERPTDLEEVFAKTLSHFEVKHTALAAHLRFVYISSVSEVEFAQHDGSMAQYFLVRIPFRSLAAFRKVSDQVIDLLEAKFKWPVMVVANRTIISPHAVTHASQKRPRSRTLKAVHSETLNDIVTPSHINGRHTRVTVEGKRNETVFLDPLDKDLMTPRLEAMAHCYKKLTTHAVHFDFAKLTSFQKKKLEQAKKQKSQAE